MTHYSVMTSSLSIKIFKNDKFCDFSYDIDYNSRTDVFGAVISLIINTSALRLLALRGLQTLRVYRFTQWALADIRETIRRFLVLY